MRERLLVAATAVLASILDALAAAGIRATFFLTGRSTLRTTQSRATGITAEGHRLGNHSQTHPHVSLDALLR